MNQADHLGTTRKEVDRDGKSNGSFAYGISVDRYGLTHPSGMALYCTPRNPAPGTLR